MELWQVGCIIVGIVLSLFCWLRIRPKALKSSMLQNILNETKKSREIFSFFCSLLIVEIGVVISLITLGGDIVDNPNMQILYAIIWITVGFAIGTLIYIIGVAVQHWYKNRKKELPQVVSSSKSGVDNSPSSVTLNLTGDISKMNKAQQETTKEIVDKLQNNKEK